MRAELITIRVGVAVRRAAAALMLGLWLALLGLAASEKLHQFLHAHAAHPEHDCLVSAFAKGSLVDVPVAIPAMRVVTLGEIPLAPFPYLKLARTDLRLDSGRAPPASPVLL